jgi:hypothetical protein
MDQLFGCLPGLGVVSAPLVPGSSLEPVVAEYREYLVNERGW